ncbi:hypothetical protein HELRODRAFT_172719 [Helobdella robusta]|uniref:Uncharacterized protein n=1 Tax=Helobdella robusta TaxID=6412 RepID=T1F5U6_HELRO|nr:hypothetical protein HELRODRAFT_172719 [Helobdella robusta]ESO04353.1 hypothetical protein HELRODRAFT_172719 [Helobdella robusta]
MAKLLPDILNKKSLNGSRLTQDGIGLLEFLGSLLYLRVDLACSWRDMRSFRYVGDLDNNILKRNQWETCEAKYALIWISDRSCSTECIDMMHQICLGGHEVESNQQQQIMKNSKLETSGASIKTRKVSIVEVFRCTQKNFQFGLERGFTVGRVILW